MVTLIQPYSEFTYGNVTVVTYHANKGEGLPAHEHTFKHITQCHAGRIFVTKQSGNWQFDKTSKAVLLKENEWHEIEAIEDGTVFVNIFVTEGALK